MLESLERIHRLHQKAEKLINLHRLLLQENERLRTEKEKLQATLTQRERELNELDEKLKVIRLAKQVAGTDQNSRELKLKINEYIREIDRCLALINH